MLISVSQKTGSLSTLYKHRSKCEWKLVLHQVANEIGEKYWEINNTIQNKENEKFFVVTLVQIYLLSN